MFETSRDLLNWVLTISIALISVFLVWALFYIVMLLKRGYAMVREISDLVMNVKEKLDRIEQLFNLVEEKLKNSASYLPLVFKGISEILEFVKNKRAARKAKKSNSQNS